MDTTVGDGAARVARVGRLTVVGTTMLFKARFHPGLRDGSVDLTFRRWSKPQAKVGNAYRFDRKPGAIVVDAITTTPLGRITPREARRAGFEDIDDLEAALRSSGTVTARTSVYRVAFHFDPSAGSAKAAPRVSAADVDALVARLGRMDRLSRRGPWTRQVLGLIVRTPRRRAGDLAPLIERELRAFKADVRKLTGMGLTTSHEVGYELTDLGRRVMEHRT